jgi:PAS domain-containing protein
VIDHNVDGMLVIDRGGVILLANPAAERLLGRPAMSLNGTQFGAPLALETATAALTVSSAVVIWASRAASEACHRREWVPRGPHRLLLAACSRRQGRPFVTRSGSLSRE